MVSATFTPLLLRHCRRCETPMSTTAMEAGCWAVSSCGKELWQLLCVVLGPCGWQLSAARPVLLMLLWGSCAPSAWQGMEKNTFCNE